MASCLSGWPHTTTAATAPHGDERAIFVLSTPVPLRSRTRRQGRITTTSSSPFAKSWPTPLFRSAGTCGDGNGETRQPYAEVILRGLGAGPARDQDELSRVAEQAGMIEPGTLLPTGVIVD